MQTIVLVVTLSFIILTLFFGFFAQTQGEKSGRFLALTSYSCTLELGALMAFFLISSDSAKEAFYSFTYAATDWALLFMLAFICEFVGRPIKKTHMVAYGSIIALDSVIFITNPINKFAADFIPVQIEDILLFDTEKTPFILLHNAIGYLVSVLIIVILIMALSRTAVFYRGKYYIVLGIYLFMFTIDVILTFAEKVSVDVTPFTLSATSVALYYSIYAYVPKGLLRNLQLYVNDNISDATILYDNSGKILSINKIAQKILRSDVYQGADKLQAYLGFPEGDGKFKKEIGDKFYEIQYKTIYDAKDQLLGKSYIFHDVTDVELRIEREHKVATRDSLTGAYNRAGFFEAANDFLYRNNSEAGFALIVCGICNFRAVNSSYGTKVGDILLRKIERTFHDYHHSYPMIYGRTAEGKFSVLLPFDYVDEIASDMGCIDITTDNGADLHVEMKHGFMVLDDFAKPLDYYYERALLALAECKKKNLSILEYSFEMEEKVKRRQQLTAEMHNAVRENQFFIEIQPQIKLEDRTISGAEALVRWQHPKLGRINPGEFIPLFEENGFIINLDVYVWEQAARLAKTLSDEGIYSGPISINVSQKDIMKLDVASILERIVNEVGIPPERLHVEITESACADRQEVLIKSMELLHQKGFILEIDDFGSGYSSLNALMHLPFDIIKLDMAFMKEKNLEGKNGIIINSIAEMIHTMNVEIIVEGVETEENIENTVRFGGDIAQGYYFSRPLPVENFKEFVKRHKK